MPAHAHNSNNNSNNNNNPYGSKILDWHLTRDSHVSWVGMNLKLWLANFLREGQLQYKIRVRKALYPWLATFLKKENSNIKLGGGESLPLVGNHLEMMPQ